MSSFDKTTADALRLQAQQHEEAAAEAAKAMVTLWRSQLEMALALNDEAAVHALIRRPITAETWNDTNCGCGGGPGTARTW